MPAPRDQLAESLARNADHIAGLEAEHANIVSASVESNADDEHDPEGSTIAFEREQVMALLQQARRQRESLLQALARLDDDRYGVCEGCGARIAEGRLEARPEARTCIDCAR